MKKYINYIAKNAGKLSMIQLKQFNHLCYLYSKGKATEKDFKDFINKNL